MNRPSPPGTARAVRPPTIPPAPARMRPADGDRLLTRIADGDRAALGDLYDRVAPTLWSIARERTVDPEHFVRSVLVRLWRTAPTALRAPTDPARWLVHTVDDALEDALAEERPA